MTPLMWPDLIWVKKGKKLEERLKICSKLDFHYSVLALYRNKVSNCIKIKLNCTKTQWNVTTHIRRGSNVSFSPDLNYCPTCKPDLLRQ